MKKIADALKKQVRWINSHKYCYILLFWPIHTLFYEIFRIVTADMDVVMVYSTLDDKIPFCEWFIIPYCIWYFYIASVLFYTLYHSKREFLRAAFLIIGCTAIPMIFFLIMPNGIEYAMRPDFDALGRDNWAIDMVKTIYASDSPPRNVMPSMHVSVAWAIAMGYTRAESLKGKWLPKVCAWVLSLFITASVVFVKQHSILDLYGGIILAVMVFIGGYIIEKVYDKESPRWKKAKEAE